MILLNGTKEKSEGDIPADVRKQSMTGKFFKTTIAVMGLILASIIIAFFTYALINGYSMNYIMKQVFPKSAEGVYKPYAMTETNFSADAVADGGGGLAYVLDGGLLSIFNDKGEEVSSRITGFENPGLSVHGDYAVIYDGKNGSFEIYKKGVQVEKGSLQRPVLGAAMQRDGYSAFILEGRDGFLGRMTLLDKSGSISAVCDYSDRYPVSACLSNDDDVFAVAGIVLDEPGETAIDIYEIGGSSPLSGKKFGFPLPSLLAGNGDVFMAVGTETAVVMDFSGVEKGRVEYPTGLEAESGRNGFFLLTEDISGDGVSFIDDEGDMSWTRKTGVKVKGMTENLHNTIYWDGTAIGCFSPEGDTIEIPGGFGTVVGTVDMGLGKISVLTPQSIVFYEYR